jgi:hypothetical protein
MSSMYRAAQKLYTSATAPSKKQKAKQEGWRVENLAAAPSPPQEDDVVVLQAAHEAYVAVDVAAPSRGGGDTNGAFTRQAVEFDVETDLAPADTPARTPARSPRAVAEAAKAAAARNKAAAAAAAPADADIDRDDADDADAEPEPVPPRVWDKYRRYRESASRVIAQLRIE